jgi:hypothetical protein
MPQLLDNVRAKVRTGHSHLSFFLALAGGLTASVSSIGGPIKAVTRFGPWWMPLLWFVALLVVCIGDWARDAIPNRPAVYTALLWPSAAVAGLSGTSGKQIFDAVRTVDKSTGDAWANWLHDVINVQAATQTAFTAFSVVFFTAAIVYARRYAKDAKGGGMAGPGR